MSETWFDRVTEADSSPTRQSTPPRIGFTARFQPALNVALFQHQVPVLSELAIASTGEEKLEDIELELRVVATCATCPVVAGGGPG